MLKGIGVSPGVSCGRVHLLIPDALDSEDEQVETAGEAKEEMAAFAQAVTQAHRQLEDFAARTKATIGASEGQIFEAHKLILTDPAFLNGVEEKIRTQGLSAAQAVNGTAAELAHQLEELTDAYLRERAVDIRDVAQRVLAYLTGTPAGPGNLAQGSIVVARELTPSLTATFSRDTVRGIATETGSRTSHSAVVARALGIPAVLGIESLLARAKEGDLVLVDGNTGTVYLNPNDALVQELSSGEASLSFRSEPAPDARAVTLDGKHIEVSANIQSLQEAKTAMESGADGIGLFRTEFLFMSRETPPNEEEQFQAYKEVAQIFQGKPVVVRTMDIGGDKAAPYLQQVREDNPFLGLRGLRLSLARREIFKTQLKALLRAANFGNFKIMFPMVSTLEEILTAKDVLQEAASELKTTGTAVSQMEIGIMVEVPAAALMADALAPHVDFFSIGTNDLTQYTLAVDRGNEKLSGLYDPYHPAVLNLIKNTVEAAHCHGKWVGLCGELGGELLALPLLLGLGLDELSMSALFVPQVKRALGQQTYRQAKELADSVLRLTTAAEVRTALNGDHLEQ